MGPHSVFAHAAEDGDNDAVSRRAFAPEPRVALGYLGPCFEDSFQDWEKPDDLFSAEPTERQVMSSGP